jgi:hypothetical protein
MNHSGIPEEAHRVFVAGTSIAIHFWELRDASDKWSRFASTRSKAVVATIVGTSRYPEFDIERNAGGSGSPWYELDKIVCLLTAAYEGGKEAKLREFRKFIGVGT